jgi:response regulator RpfG family c-di-GMP phosphodiesterase
MSSQAQSDGPSADPEPARGAAQPATSLADLVSERGQSLLKALDDHLPGSLRHADGTASLSYATAVNLGLRRDRAETIREAARLHDIGKLYVPAKLLVRDPANLSPEEAELVENHYDAAAGLARGAGLPSTVAAWLTTIRERFDGRGPERLADEDIPLESRIIRAACGCDLLQGYAGQATDSAELQRSVVASLWASAGAELDPRVVEALVAELKN